MKRMLLALFLTLVLVVPAAAAPPMLAKGHKSLTFEADPDSPSILFGYNVAEMTKFSIGGGLDRTRYEIANGQSQPQSSSTTIWEFQAGISRYLEVISKNIPSPFIGVQMNVRDSGANQKTSFGARGYFGMEAFIVESLSIGGNIGINYIRDGDLTKTYQDAQGQTVTQTISDHTAFTTSTSAFLATLYW